MMRFALFFIASAIALGQPKSISNVSTTAPVDFGSALTTKPVKVGTSAPGTCSVGELFFDSDATAGVNLFGCTATNTWTQLGGSGGSVTQHAWFSLVAADAGLNKYPSEWNGGSAPNAITTSGGAYPIGLAELPDGGGSGVIKWRIPSTYVSGNLTFWMQVLTGNTSGGNITLTVGTACGTDGEDFTALTYTDASPSTMAVASTTLTASSFSVVLPMTGCAAGESMMVRIVRGTDSHTGSAYGVVAEISGVW